MGVPEIKDTGKGTENLFEIQWPKLQDFKSKKKNGYTNSSNLKDSNQDKYKETLRHIIIKLLKVTYKVRVLKTAREKKLVACNDNHKENIAYIHREMRRESKPYIKKSLYKKEKKSVKHKGRQQGGRDKKSHKTEN